MISLKIIQKAKLRRTEDNISNTQKECNELISIFAKSVETAKRNLVLSKS